MIRKEKLIKRFLTQPRDFTWDELVVLLAFFQFSEVSTSKTGGSRRRFINEEGLVISLHKPHPRKILKKYQIEQVMDILDQEGLL